MTNKNILIIDDDQGFRKTLSDILKLKGYTPVAYGQGKEAIGQLDYDKPLVALVDLKLEDISGLTLLEQIKSCSPYTECILLTGHASQDSAIRAVNMGAYGYLQKPYPIEQLLLMIQGAMEKQAAIIALQESEERFRQVISSISDNIYMTELTEHGDYINRYFSPNVERLTGYSHKDLLVNNRFWSMAIVHPDDVLLVDSHSATLASGNNSEIEYRLVRADGRLIWVRDSARVKAERSVKVIYGVVSDITERRQAQESLRTYASQLEQSNRELQEFAYIASHDLQEPLRKIQTFGNRLRLKYQTELDDRGQDYLARMQHAAARMQSLIEDLLVYSRVTTKAKPFASVNLNEIVQNVLTDLELRLEEVNGQVDSDPLPTIEADPTQMRQLFQNLIGNALKFHQPGGVPLVSITSKVQPDEQFYNIKVTDNGIGFASEHADRIFGVFQRLHGRTAYDGTGVGLAICRKIVERHGGTIVAAGQQGQGAVFTITLPRQQANDEQPEP